MDVARRADIVARRTGVRSAHRTDVILIEQVHDVVVTDIEDAEQLASAFIAHRHEAIDQHHQHFEFRRQQLTG